MEMFKKGDKFIHYTKHGGVNIGEVADTHLVRSHDLKNLCVYLNYSIFTTNGVRLSLDGSDGRVYKIDEQITQEMADTLDKKLKSFQVKRHRNSPFRCLF